MLVDIETAFEQRVAQAGGRIHWGSLPFKPAKNEPYLQARVAGRSSSPVTVGPKPVEEWSGELHVVVVHPSGENQKRALRRAEDVRDLFPIGGPLAYGQAQIHVHARSVEAAYETADWLNVPVVIRWWCQEIPA
jgi:hypothetical protein